MKKYNKIFWVNEYKTIRGRYWSNFWILFAVFLITLGSLSFSRGGLEFLHQKMEDPFINWIDVRNNPNLEKFYTSLDRQEIKDRYGFSTIEKNVFILEYVFSKDDKKFRVEGRTIEDDSKLLDKVLGVENTIIKREDSIKEKDIGLVVTRDLMERLGYENPEDYPLFINISRQTAVPMLVKECELCGRLQTQIDTVRLNQLGITELDTWQKIPVPIIAVVKQLPDVLDFLATPFFSQQLEAGEKSPFNLKMHDNYFNRIQFVVGEDFVNNVKTTIDRICKYTSIEWENTVDYRLAFSDAKLISAIVRDTTISDAGINQLCDSIVNYISNSGVKIYRYYDYEFCSGFKINTDYVSIMFNRLDRVKSFQVWAKDEFNIRIDMAQIEAKENFQIFNNLAAWLSFAIIVISIVFVIIFLYFLINSHFQKISKNLGTIMAFGLDNNSIIRIYLAVFMKLIFISMLVAFIVLFGVQFLFNVINFGYGLNGQILPYLNMLDWLVLTVLGGILMLSVITTFFIMNKKLKSTPGDLIYERNN